MSYLEINQKYFLKIILIGNSGVGKTTLLKRYTKDFYDDNVGKTIAVGFGNKKVILENGKTDYELSIWDLSGEEHFKKFHDLHLPGVNGCFFIFDLTDPKSLSDLPGWLLLISKYINIEIPIIAIGTKADLIKERKIKNSEAVDFCKLYNLEYIECSAKTGQNVKSIFNRLGNKIIDHFNLNFK